MNVYVLVRVSIFLYFVNQSCHIYFLDYHLKCCYHFIHIYCVAPEEG